MFIYVLFHYSEETLTIVAILSVESVLQDPHSKVVSLSLCMVTKKTELAQSCGNLTTDLSAYVI